MTIVSVLTDREQEVVIYVLQGKSNKQIAKDLSISLRTVEQHLTNIYGKIGVTSRSEAIILLINREAERKTLK